MSYGYGGRNPFDQRDDAPSGGYGAPGGGYGAPARAPPGGGYGQGPAPYGRNQYGGNTMEMSSMSTGGGGGAQPSILDECRAIDNDLRGLNSRLEDLRRRQGEVLNDASGTADAKRALDNLSEQIMEQYRELSNRVIALKSRRDASTYSKQVERIDRQVKEAIQSRLQMENAYKKKAQEQIARQVRNVAGDSLSDDEVYRIAEEGSGQQFITQTIMRSGRQAQAAGVLNQVRDRDAQIRKIERDMAELLSLFNEMNQMVVEQGNLVDTIDQRAEETTENLDKGNQEIEVAVNTARSTRKKKWWCLGISVLIVVIIVAGILIWMAVTGKFGNNNNNNNGGNNNGGNNNKRSMLDELNLDVALVRSVPSRSSRIMKRIALPAAGQPDAVQDAVAARFDSGGSL